MDYLKEHLNVWWLRPEQALWDARASEVAAPIPMPGPSLDLGCGNGLYSFVAAGGAFGPGYDWFVHSRARGFRKNKDTFDVALSVDPARHIVRRPKTCFDWAFDHKANLLSQAGRLGLYKNLACGDAEGRLPFEDGSLRTVYSNILYWLHDPAARLKELRRILHPGGRALLCLQDPSFKRICESYQWKARRSELLRLLNRGRAACSFWTITLPGLKSLARRSGFKLVHHETYLSETTLKFWDIGTRPLTPPLLEMSHRLSAKDRRAVKASWIEALTPLLEEMLSLERKDRRPGGYHFAVLEKAG